MSADLSVVWCEVSVEDVDVLDSIEVASVLASAGKSGLACVMSEQWAKE